MFHCFNYSLYKNFFKIYFHSLERQWKYFDNESFQIYGMSNSCYIAGGERHAGHEKIQRVSEWEIQRVSEGIVWWHDSISAESTGIQWVRDRIRCGSRLWKVTICGCCWCFIEKLHWLLAVNFNIGGYLIWQKLSNLLKSLNYVPAENIDLMVIKISYLWILPACMYNQKYSQVTVAISWFFVDLQKQNKGKQTRKI